MSSRFLGAGAGQAPRAPRAARAGRSRATHCAGRDESELTIAGTALPLAAAAVPLCTPSCPGRSAARARANSSACPGRSAARSDALQTPISGLPEIGAQMRASRVNPTCVDRYAHRASDGPGSAVHRSARATRCTASGTRGGYSASSSVKSRRFGLNSDGHIDGKRGSRDAHPPEPHGAVVAVEQDRQA